MQQLKKASIWEKAPMLRILFAFIVGIIVYDFDVLRHIKASYILMSFILAFGATLALRLKGNYPIGSSIASLLSICILAFGICFVNDAKQNAYFFGNQLKHSSATVAVVTNGGTEKEKTIKYEVALLKSFSNSGVETTKGNGFLYLYKDSSEGIIRLGDTLILPNRWELIRNSGNPFEMNYQKFCSRKNIHFQQFIAFKELLVYASRNRHHLSFLEKTNRYCIHSVNENIKDSNTNALLKAMLLGDERDIDPNMRDAYADTGIIHIISISGAHVAILFAAIGLIFKLTKTKKHSWIKVVFSLVLIWFYVLLSGASTPALRAAIMFSILIIGDISNRRSNPLNHLFSAALILLLINPMWLFTIGFQLSFTAVLSLMIFYQAIASIYSSQNKILQFFINAFAASVAAEILVAPLVAFYFHSFPPMFIVANLLASVAMSFVLILGMMLLLFAPIKFLAALISTLITLISQLFHHLIVLLQQMNISYFKTIYVSPIGLFYLLLFIAFAAHFLLSKYKQSLWMSLLVLFMFSVIHVHRSWQISEQQNLIVYNQSRVAQIELIQGNTFYTLYGESKESFATRNAHVGMGATEAGNKSPNNVLVLKGYKVLTIDSNSVLPSKFLVDVLVIKSWPQKVDVAELKKIFTPKQIVIANNVKTYQADEWTKQCHLENIRLHYTKKDGAFIFPN